ncbi:upstream stimulatory factor 2 [Trichonephila inaurata madagascariensis]|uniref:Upstream stimulatory factor 2 n=1 Tax=Trichonephila inaurata madagascariensis TaxID=2747483 RepID=A0A8X6X333_9ARAC|nr:upstream stimulatory factor 2 [Trichonephila inaurata madagascariensis]
MDLLDEEIDGSSVRTIKSEKDYLQEVYVNPKIATMDVNGDDSANAGRWEVVEVIQDLNSGRNLHSDIICAEGLNSQDKVNPDDPPAITDATGTVTYRVVQLAADGSRDDGQGTQIVTTSAAIVAGGQQVTQAIIANPFNAANGSASPGAEGPFYVMMSPQEVLQTGQRTLAPRTHQFSPKLEGGRTARDERRRATHNEVERRRRDKINNWIVKLSKIVPDCTSDHTKQGQFYSQSKGGILAKACDYITELRNSCARLPDVLKENERLNLDLDALPHSSPNVPKWLYHETENNCFCYTALYLKEDQRSLNKRFL